ncbi:hypothetical protein Tco_0680001 [Tanacetum coccineum]|uniref:Uncharacterized protein n=1 Tax=Tanacetum coccineum TaxID=301880 RepID=A0ABQ4XK37_9ASTR
MENANPPPTSNRPVQPTALRAQAIQELYELQRISAFVDSRLENNDSDDGEVLNELICVVNVGLESVAYLTPSYQWNHISRKAPTNTIMVEGLESTRKNLVAVIRDVYVFVGSFTYITDFVVIFDEKKLGSSQEVSLDDSWMTI